MEDREARRLIETYADMILRISTHYLKSSFDAEDICQTVLIKYITSKVEFDSPTHEKAWIARTTINCCKDELKSAFFRKTTILEDIEVIKSYAEPGLGVTEEVMKLPRNYRMSIFLYYYEGYSVKEIADILGKKETAVMAYLSRGRKKLRFALEGDQYYGK